MTILFLVLRRTQERLYSPRSYLGSLRQQERSPALPKSLFGWLPAFHKVGEAFTFRLRRSLANDVFSPRSQIPDTYVLQHNSLDGYFLLRFLKIITIICFVGCCITWPILFPINATGGVGKQQLDLLTFGQPSSLSAPRVRLANQSYPANVSDTKRYYGMDIFHPLLPTNF